MGMRHTRRVFFVSLGCAKSLVDSEQVLGKLEAIGFQATTEIKEAHVAVVNTCAFIQSAVEESINSILELAKLKSKGELEKLIVVGCFVQRYGYKLRKEIPEVDGWLGTGEICRLPQVIDHGSEGSRAPFYINRPVYLTDHNVSRIQTTPFFTSYLKIAEGCSHRCTFCMVPRLRGPLRSRSLESLMVEAQEMVARGVKEINLVAQDVSIYGKDLGDGTCLEELLERLVSIRDLAWIRLLYCHPEGVTSRLLELIESEESICPYLDIPFQHVNKNILEAMGRKRTSEDPRETVERIRSLKREVSIRTTLMVGFPGESEGMFRELLDFVRWGGLEHLGVFTYSREKGTAAARLSPAVPGKVAQERKDAIMRLQAGISKKNHRRLVGRTLPVLVEGTSPETELLLKGRTSAMAPDVDEEVLINKGEGMVGEIALVKIIEAHEYDLIGEIV